eukprot:3413390-Alexandrium_andersonii.AAC.1
MADRSRRPPESGPSLVAAPQRARTCGLSAGINPATKLSLPRSERAWRFRMKPRRTKSATPLRISWSFFSGM